MNTEKTHTEWIDPIIDYLTGNGSETTEQHLKEWIAASEANKQYFEEIKELWQSFEIASENKLYDPQKAFRLFKERIRAQLIPMEKTFSVKRNRMRRRIAAAAVLIPFFFLSYFTAKYFAEQPGKAVSLSEVIVPYGSTTQLTLQDGTKVWLNAGSSIIYDAGFKDKERVVKLSGEAYLEVTHDKKRPFIVSTSNLDIKVLGTSFNVNAYPENPTIEVALLDGSVQLQAAHSTPLILSPNETASYHINTKQMTVRSAQNRYSTAWTENKLIFDGETFEEIARILERHFNVSIHIRKEEVKERRFKGDFMQNETVEKIFEIISTDGKFKYKINGNYIDIY